MNEGPAPAYVNTQPEAPTPRVVDPFRADRATRLIYCVALVALILSALIQASSWVGLATGGGLIGWAGGSAFLLLCAAITYRIYRVLRYREALDARPPNAFGYLLRGLGWLLMLAGTIGAASLILVKPLTFLIFGGGGQGGIAFFVVGLYGSFVAGVGWVGCLLFEISRPLGKRVTRPTAPRTRRQLLQDRGAFAGLLLLALALPWFDKLVGGEACLGGKTLGACAAAVDGGVKRMAMAPVGGEVMLQSNLDAIEYRHKGGGGWTVIEKPAVSLLKSGHPPAPQGGRADVRVAINAVESDGGVMVTLVVTEKGEETASFVTRFKSRARLETASDGRGKLVVELQRNVEQPLRFRREEPLDEIYRQVRAAIGSEREVAEAKAQVMRSVKLLSSTMATDWVDRKHATPAKSCAGILKYERRAPEAAFSPMGSFLAQLVFVQQPAPAPVVLLFGYDSVGCYGDAVWAASQHRRERQLRIRKYDMAGRLQRHILVESPQRNIHDYFVVDESSFVERNGQLEFDVGVLEFGKDVRKRERFGVKL